MIMKKLIAPAVLGAMFVFGAAVAARADVQVSIQNGKVSITAKDAMVRDILAEWGRVGRTRIVNGEKVTGGPLTLQLVDVPEEQALRTVLRSVSGYVAAPRATVEAGASRFDRILVMPTSTAPPPSPANRGNTPPAQQAPVFQPRVIPDAQPQEDDQNGAAVMPNIPGLPPTPNAPRPVFNPFPQPQISNPAAPQAAQPQVVPTQQQQPATPPVYQQPTAPFGTAVPGMPIPVPQQGQPAPNQPPQPE